MNVDERSGVGTTPEGRSTKLGQTIALTPTEIWNDSCSLEELGYAISFGATGATANPTIVTDVWTAAPSTWRSRVQAIARDHPDATEVDLAWTIIEEMSTAGAALLTPEHLRSAGRRGRLSIQVDPTYFGSIDRMLEQSRRFDALAANMIVKFPSTSAGIAAMEVATYEGTSVNATVSFTVAQALAAGEAIERGLRRRESEGLPTAHMGPVVTIMMGRLEDWLRVLSERDGVTADPTAIPWSGIAVFKRAYAEFQGRGLRARLLGAAIRHRLHWSELIGGDVAITMPSVWQRRFNASHIEVSPRIDAPIEARVMDELVRHFPDFTRAIEPDGLTLAEFDLFGPTVRTLRTFISSYTELLALVRDARLVNPDIKPAAASGVR